MMGVASSAGKIPRSTVILTVAFSGYHGLEARATSLWHGHPDRGLLWEQRAGPKAGIGVPYPCHLVTARSGRAKLRCLYLIVKWKAARGIIADFGLTIAN